MELLIKIGVENFFGHWTIYWNILGWDQLISWGKIRKDEWIAWTMSYKPRKGGKKVKNGASLRSR